MGMGIEAEVEEVVVERKDGGGGCMTANKCCLVQIKYSAFLW